MDIRIDTNRYTVGAPPAAVRFAPGILAGQANCASEVSFPPNHNSGPFGPYPPQASQQQGPVGFSQPPGGFTNFYATGAPPSSSFNTTPKKGNNRNNNYTRGGYEQNFQRFNAGPPVAQLFNANNVVSQPPFRRCNSMGVASAPVVNNNANNFRMNVPQPPPISVFGQQEPPPPYPPPPGLPQQLPHRDLGRSRPLPPQQQLLLPSQSTHQHKRYVMSLGGVQKSKKKYDRQNKNNNNNQDNQANNQSNSGYQIRQGKALKDKRSQGFYDSTTSSSLTTPRQQKRKWNKRNHEMSKRFFADRSKKFTKWTECNSRDIARVHRNCVENGQPLAPYNTTQFIMNEHMAEKEFDFDENSGQIQHHRRMSEGSDFDETEEYSSPAEDETQYLERQFNEAFQSYHRESLTKKSKDELVTDILVLEKKYTTLTKSHSSSIRAIGRNRAKDMKHRQTRRLLREMYLRHNRLANAAAESVASDTNPTEISSNNNINTTNANKRVKLEEHQLPDDLDYMVQYCIRESESDEDDDDGDSDSSGSSSSDCDSEYSSSTDSSYDSEDACCLSDVELEVAGVIHDMLDLIELNFQQ